MERIKFQNEERISPMTKIDKRGKIQMAQLQIVHTVGLLLQERGRGFREQLHTGDDTLW